MIWGGRDHSHKHTDPASLLHEVPHAEIVHFPDCGHFPDLEQSRRYADILIERVMRYNTGKPVGTPS
jgi:pimeloyl-ACP methyl ester carboxylesterase